MTVCSITRTGNTLLPSTRISITSMGVAAIAGAESGTGAWAAAGTPATNAKAKITPPHPAGFKYGFIAGESQARA